MGEKKVMQFREAIKHAMVDEMRLNEDVFLIGEDVGIFGGDFGTTVGMIEEFGPERVIDTPISEAAISGLATGAASVGMRPIVDMTFMDFITIAMDSIVNQAAPMRYMLGGEVQVPVVFRCANGAGTGASSQHSKTLESWFTHIPGLKVVAPSNPNDAYGLLRAAIRDNNPVIYLEPKSHFGMKGEVDASDDNIAEIGKGKIVREGKDVTIVSWGKAFVLCEKAAEELAKEGVDVELVDIMTLIPLDEKVIFDSVKKTGKLVVVHDSFKTSGFGGEIVARVVESEAFDFIDAPIRRVASADTHVPSAPNLEKAVQPSVEKVKEAVLQTVNKK